MAERLAAGPSMIALVGDRGGPTLWRTLWPISALKARGYPADWDYAKTPAVRRWVEEHDGCLFARTSWPTWARGTFRGFMEEAHDAGRFVVLDYDDDLLTAGFVWRQIELGWTEGKTYEQLEQQRCERIWALTQADGVTVSTEPLADVVRSFTSRPVVVVPNAIDVAWFRTALGRARRQLRPPVIGWAGGRRPDDDLRAMAEGWRRTATRYQQVTFLVQGHVPAIITDAVPADRLVTVPWLPLERYPEPLRDVDIACCAVASDRFNACKTTIKAWEAAIAGCAVVATPFLYGDVIERGSSGLLAETADEWEAHLAVLVERPSYRALLAGRLKRTVEREHALAVNVHRWPAAWSVIQDSARERHARVIMA